MYGIEKISTKTPEENNNTTKQSRYDQELEILLLSSLQLNTK